MRRKDLFLDTFCCHVWLEIKVMKLLLVFEQTAANRLITLNTSGSGGLMWPGAVEDQSKMFLNVPESIKPFKKWWPAVSRLKNRYIQDIFSISNDARRSDWLNKWRKTKKTKPSLKRSNKVETTRCWSGVLKTSACKLSSSQHRSSKVWLNPINEHQGSETTEETEGDASETAGRSDPSWLWKPVDAQQPLVRDKLHGGEVLFSHFLSGSSSGSQPAWAPDSIWSSNTSGDPGDYFFVQINFL